jgi:NADPH2:quinone reductase
MGASLTPILLFEKLIAERPRTLLPELKAPVMTNLPANNQIMSSLLKESGELELALVSEPMPKPQDHEVLLKVLAAPINPSDLASMVGFADVSSARLDERDGLPLTSVAVPQIGVHLMKGRIGQAMPLGTEGCGVVVQAGAAPEAQALLGKIVATFSGGMYAQYRCVPAAVCMQLPDGTNPADGASCFVNPMTSLAFTEVMRLDGHTALVHTAAASNLGQMLVRICAKDDIPLVNIVRSAEQVALLQGIGAKYVVNSSSSSFAEDLVAVLSKTGATLGFDAIGGGMLTNQIFSAMESAALKRSTGYNRYGSDTFKQMYIYGGLDISPTMLIRSFGFSWSLSGFLLTPFMKRVGPEGVDRMRKRVVDELTTTFKSHYSHEISLAEALDPVVLAAFNAKRTGEKYLIRP